MRKEAEKFKEQVSSSDVRIKWAQNKLRAELDGHKVRLSLKWLKIEFELNWMISQ